MFSTDYTNLLWTDTGQVLAHCQASATEIMTREMVQFGCLRRSGARIQITTLPARTCCSGGGNWDNSQATLRHEIERLAGGSNAWGTVCCREFNRFAQRQSEPRHDNSFGRSSIGRPVIRARYSATIRWFGPGLGVATS